MMNKKTNLIQIFLTIASLGFFTTLFHGCEEKNEDEQIIIEYRLPDTMQFGTRDTLYFKIKSLQSIDTVRVIESDIVYATFNNRTFGRGTYIWDVNLVYNPASPGIKALEFWVRAGIHIKTHRFSINVVE